jgi:hypothetical protein
MMGEKLTARVENYLLYYLNVYGETIDLREFGLLAFEAILREDKVFAKWEREKTAPKTPGKTPVVNGKDEGSVRGNV